MIENSIRSAHKATEPFTDVAGFVEKIAGTASRMKALIAQVSATAAEQHTGTERIAQAMTQMRAGCMQTAASADESAATAEELNSMASSLIDSVGQLSTLMGKRS